MLRNCFAVPILAALAWGQRTVIETGVLMDGKNQEIVIEAGRIARIADAAEKPTVDLSGLTVGEGRRRRILDGAGEAIGAMAAHSLCGVDNQDPSLRDPQ